MYNIFSLQQISRTSNLDANFDIQTMQTKSDG